jgi:prolyl oligopeptidase
VKRIVYPPAQKVDQFDEYHGVRVADPYRWMENVEDPELKPWVDAQSGLAEQMLKGLPCRRRFERRLEELSRLPSVGTPVARGKRWFQPRNPGDLEHAGLYVLDDLDSEGRLLLDPRPKDNELIVDTRPSPDGSIVLFAKSVGGSDWRTWHVMDVETKKVLDDRVSGSKLWAAWLPDNSGFLYQYFPSEEGDKTTRATFQPQLRLHLLGTEQDSDLLIYEDVENPHYFFAAVSSDGRHLLVTPLMTKPAEVLYAPIGDWNLQTLTRADDQMWFIGSGGGEFFFSTTSGAPYGRVVAVEEGRPDADEWRTAVKETEQPLLPYSNVIADDWIITVRDFLGRSTVSADREDGSDHYVVELPEECRVGNADISEPMGVSPDGTDIYFSVTSLSSPSMLLRHDTRSRTTDIVHRVTDVPDLKIESDVVWAPSQDGTRVPMTLVKSATNVTEDPPVIIEGYGGGGDSMHPFDFVAWKVAWMEAGGVVGSAHLRGGRELGAEWQDAAARGGKLKAMEDFMGCADYLVENQIISPDRIGIVGRSSGAMLAAAAAISRPELFSACILEVGMFDPLRYHLFGLGRLMVEEYGTSENREDFEAMYAYSPLHRISDETKYPAMLLTVHTDDDRVAPGSGFKFAARIQESQAGTAPVLLRMRSGAGHHGGDLSGDIEERADILAFAAQQLKLAGCS